MVSRRFGMKTVAAVLLGLGLLGCAELAARSQEKKEDPKEEKKDEKKEDKKDKKDTKEVVAPILTGNYKLVAGKINDKAIGDDVKKWTYTFTADKITISDPSLKKDEKKEEKKEEKKDDKKEPKKEDKAELMFVIGYKLDAKTVPINIEMEVLSGPEGTKGIKTGGIIELKGDVLKLAYIMEKDKRPKDFEGKVGNMFELKREK
jgi:uncharacterized protein (TIGR03067 family)